ncbi:ubiquitin family domain-containing protein [Ditylenchus destructor]|uniref:Ubiquitin family domain-containing protein n=1 Tax=Ditylenchus destructor TaxID=166010 RepID=A0AAD4MQL6_9BILA|nr:ubiquitin family domain-containing protein [Ditylenchus destructor]
MHFPKFPGDAISQGTPHSFPLLPKPQCLCHVPLEAEKSVGPPFWAYDTSIASSQQAKSIGTGLSSGKSADPEIWLPEILKIPDFARSQIRRKILTDLMLNSIKSDPTKTNIGVVVARLLPAQIRKVIVVDINDEPVKGFRLNPYQSVEYIKELIHGVKKIPPENQSLIFQGQELKDQNGMLPPELTSGSIVKLVIKTRTGGQN